METKAWEQEPASAERQQLVVDQWAVQSAVAAAKAYAVSPAELLAVCAALHREAARGIKTGMVVQATAFDGASATAQVETLEGDAVSLAVVQTAVAALVRQATPALWAEILEVLKAPPEFLGEWVRGPAS